MFYLFLALLLFAFSMFHLLRNTAANRIEITTLFVCFWLLGGLAYQTGIDWRVYASGFSQTVPLYEIFSNRGFFEYGSGIITEPGFGLLSSFVKMFTDDFQILMLACNLIATIFFFKGLKKYTKHYYVVILIYFGYIYLALNMSGLRQAVALSIIFYALQFIKEKKVWKYVVWVVIAATFHTSAFIMLPAYFILNRIINIKTIYIIAGIGLLFYLCRISVLSILITKIATLSDNYLLLKGYQYITQVDEPPGISPKVLLNFIMLVLLLRRRSSLVIRNPYAGLFINMYFLYICVFEFFWDTGEISSRLQFYFVLGLVIMLPEWVYSFKRLSNRIAGLSYALVLSLWSYQIVFFESPIGKPYTPYQNYLVYKILNLTGTGEDRLDEFTDD